MLELTLQSAGTLDTVIEAECNDCEDVTLHRFTDVERGDDGYILQDACQRLEEELIDAHAPYCAR